MKKIIISIFAALLFISSCKKSDTANTPETPDTYSEGILKSNTIIVSSDSLNISLVSVDSTKLTFAQNGAGVSKLKIGSILVSDITAKAPFGFIRKVIGMNVVGGNIIYQTENASLIDALETGKVKYIRKFDDNDITSVDTSGIDITLFRGNILPSFTIPLDNQFGAIKTEGQIKIEPEFEFELDISKSGNETKVTNFKVALTLKNTNKIKAIASGVANLNQEIILATFPLKPFTINVGPLPIPIAKQWVVIVLGVNGTVEAKLSIGAENTNTKTVGILYQNGGWTKIDNVTNSFTKYPLEFDGRAVIEPYVQVRYEIQPYAIRDSRIYLGVKGGVLCEIRSYPSNPCVYKATLNWDLELRAKANMKIFDRTIIDYDDIILSRQYPIFDKDTSTLKVKTDVVTAVTSTSAVCGGEIANPLNCPQAIVQRGVCWDTFPNPNLLDLKSLNGIGPGTFTSNLTNLKRDKIYYVRAYATTSTDTIFGNEQIFKTKKYQIGDTAFGGIIFYLDSTNLHGLVCSKVDVDSNISPCPDAFWTPTHSHLSVIINGTDESVGSGKNNTNIIMSILGNTYYAASACKNYSSEGYTDWFLPSADEVSEICKSKQYLGNVSASYWSSTVYGNSAPGSSFFSIALSNINVNCSIYYWAHMSNSPTAAIRAVKQF